MKQSKTNGKRKRKLKEPELIDAKFAATPYSQDCTLILTQGRYYNKNLATCGLSVLGQDYYGMFPLERNLPNVKEASAKQLKENHGIQNIIKHLGLQYGKVYEDAKELRYGHLMIIANQDHYGSHFKGLLINFFHSFWPSLLKVPNFILEFVPPIVKAFNEKTKEVLSFYTLPEYEAWKNNLGNEATKYKIKIYSYKKEEAAEYFADLDNYTKDFVWADDEDGDAIELAFSNKKIKARKDWLRAFQAGTYIDSKEKHIRYRDFINKELILFSMADLQRSIPSMVDGLKPDQRKILFCALKKPIIEEIEVGSFNYYVLDHFAYHHDQVNRFVTIIGMAQNYVGSNNINLLQPKGKFGTRQNGGKDHAKGERIEYIRTQLSPITRYLFHKADELLLNFLNDDGQSVEPAWFIPVIPMVLVNGSEARAWSSFIPNYNPRDIIANLKRLLKGEAMVPMHPWYKGFKGDVVKTTSKDTLYTTKGIIIEDNNALTITELPVMSWTQNYKKYLDAASRGGKDIEAYKARGDDISVHFEITMTEDQMNRARQEGFLKKFKLTTKLSTANMHLLDANGKLKKYDTPEQILEDFFHLRLDFYEKRRTALLRELKKALLVIENKLMYINDIRDEKIDFRWSNIRTCAELEARGFKSLPSIARAVDHVGKKEIEVEEEVAAGEEKPQGNASETVLRAGYDYLLRIPFASMRVKNIEELEQERDAKNKELHYLTNTPFESLWLRDLDALDHQLALGNYPPAESSPKTAEEAPKKKAPAKRAAASPFPHMANKKRLKR